MRVFALLLLALLAGCAAGPDVDWVKIPGGRFHMGADDGPADSKPRHLVEVRPFQLARTLTTKSQYARCVKAGRCEAPGCQWPVANGAENHPVVCVSWDDARRYAEWAGGRLPSEAEWEYAARGAGEEWTFPWGEAAPTCELARVSGCGGHGAAPVCATPKGNTVLGLCDMAGEVWQWTADGYHRSYEGAPADGSAWQDPYSKARVNRGGSWDYHERVIRSYDRNQTEGSARSDDLGFRPAK